MVKTLIIYYLVGGIASVLFASFGLYVNGRKRMTLAEIINALIQWPEIWVQTIIKLKKGE